MQAFGRLRDRLNTTEVSAMLAESHLGSEPGSNEVDVDDTIELALAKIAQMSGNAAVVVARDGNGVKEVVGVFDIFCCLSYVLNQYRGTLEKREQVVVHREYDAWWFSDFDQWTDRVQVIIPTADASRKIELGAAAFFSESIQELMNKDELFARDARIAPLKQAVDSRALLSQVLPVLQSYSSVPIHDPETGYQVLTQHDLVELLYRAVLATNLQGLGDRKIKKLVAYKKPLLVATATDRALLILMKMRKHAVTAIPLIDATSGKILQEFSVMSVSAVHASNFGVLLGTAQAVLDAVDPFFSGLAIPIIARKDSTIGEIVELMWRHKRSHVWICYKDNVGRGVVALSDIMKVLNDGVLAAENGGKKKVKKSERFNKTKSMKHMKRL